MDRIEEFQELLVQKAIDAYIIPSSDFHMSEYTPAYFKVREYISGFTGDAGTLVITQDEALLWTDGRFFIQAEMELKGSNIKLMKMGESGVPTIIEYLSNKFLDGGNLGFDSRTIDTKTALNLRKQLPDAEIINVDLVPKIFEDRPAMPFSYLYIFDECFSGASYKEKLIKVRAELSRHKCNSTVIAKLEDQAWLYNLRASDIECTPVFLAFTIITNDEVRLFIDKEKLTDEVKKYLDSNDIKLSNYDDIYNQLQEMTGLNILYDPSSCNYNIYRTLYRDNNLVAHINPTTELKAIKNPTEIRNTIKAHIKDGVAMVKAMYYLYNHANELDEISFAKYLDDTRAETQGFISPSFETISGFDIHGAIVHYSAKPETKLKLDNTHPTFFLVDSGAHYCLGTTDITRTFVLGEATEQMKEDYTTVLKCHIDLATSVFKDGTTGEKLDVIARQPLWNRGLDFRHGTGHGVGHVLSVHEGPQAFRYHGANYPIKPGMITTDEPGLYREGKYGIRIENELLCIDASNGEYGKFYKFQNITYCPYEPKAINKELLSKKEIDWLNAYNKECYETLSPYLSNSEKSFLKDLTKEL